MSKEPRLEGHPSGVPEPCYMWHWANLRDPGSSNMNWKSEFPSCKDGVSSHKWRAWCPLKKPQQLLVWDWVIVAAATLWAMAVCSLTWIGDRETGPLKKHSLPQQHIYWVMLKVMIEIGNLFSLFSPLPAGICHTDESDLSRDSLQMLNVGDRHPSVFLDSCAPAFSSCSPYLLVLSQFRLLLE